MKITTIYAHPADTITNCGGALHADAGDDIVAVILTHGGRIHPNKYAEELRKENPDPAIVAAGLQDVIDNKKDKLRGAAKIIGVGTLVTLDHDDTMSTVHEDVVTERAATLLQNVDGKAEVTVKQLFLTGLPSFARKLVESNNGVNSAGPPASTSPRRTPGSAAKHTRDSR